jgi:hypothetical protein
MIGTSIIENISYINAQASEALRQGYRNICIYNYRLMSAEADYFFKPDCLDEGLNLTATPFRPTFVDSGFAGVDNDYHFFLEECCKGERHRIDLIADLHYALTYLKSTHGIEHI